MTKIALVLATVVLAALISHLVRANRTALSIGTDHHIPDQLDLSHFARASGRWLVVVFSSSTCETCREVVANVEQMATTDLFTATADLERDPDLHRHYRIDAIPTTVIADPEGITRKSFLGPVSRAALSNSLAEVVKGYESGNV